MAEAAANGLSEKPPGVADPAEALNLLKSAEDNGLDLRLLGGLAVVIHCSETPGPLLRTNHADIDFVTSSGRKVGRRLDSFFDGNGFRSHVEFNALHGHRRRLYENEAELQVDVFVGEFSMCHTIPIDERLDVDQPTIPLAELVLTKAQVVELSEKDVTDLLALLLEHQVGASDEETINSQRIAELCARDWGLWRTVTGTLTRLEEALSRYSLPPETASAVRRRIQDLRKALDAAPKGMKWKTRDRIGDRVAWYEIPDEKED
jgi:hypothetical protein